MKIFGLTGARLLPQHPRLLPRAGPAAGGPDIFTRTGLDSKRLMTLARAAPLLVGITTIVLVALSASLAYVWSERRDFARLDDAVGHQLELYAAVLEIELGKQADLPGLIDQDDRIDALVRAPDGAELRALINRKLIRFVARSGALQATIVDADGRTIASSDWYRFGQHVEPDAPPDPCALEAAHGQIAQRFARNPFSGAPEVCFGRPVQRDGMAVGAVVVRISLQPIEATWIDSAFRAESEKPLIVDADGMVIMSSVPEWKGQRLDALARPDRAEPGSVPLVRVPRLKASGFEMQVVHERQLPRLGWRLLILTNAKDVWRDARTAAWSAGAGAALLGMLAMLVLLRRRVGAQKLATRVALQRANDELEAKVLERTTQLEDSNQSLRREVAERQHAEEVLRHAQEELVQAGKLALLGQLSAGISHELGQPLTALRALAQNGCLLLDRERPLQARENFKSILGLAERMGRITSQLKSFARKTPQDARSLPFMAVVDNARQVLAARLADEGVTLALDVAPALAVRCDAYRLEQVLVNLMANALDAMRTVEPRLLTVGAAAQGERVVVRVLDSGPGIPQDLAERLFEPFFTTKAPGEGLGLGLVISSHIVREFGGSLRSVPVPAGAMFEFDLAGG
jgi:C4-dicarboxylate-specific signal transduction histidine kinase